MQIVGNICRRPIVSRPLSRPWTNNEPEESDQYDGRLRHNTHTHGEAGLLLRLALMNDLLPKQNTFLIEGVANSCAQHRTAP
jgi:hypothetical protein